MASNWYIMFVFGLVLAHVVTSRNIPQAEIEGVMVNTEVISRAPTPSEGLDDKNNFISFGGIGGLGGIGGDARGIGGLGGVGGDRNGVGGLGGLGGNGGIGGIGGTKP